LAGQLVDVAAGVDLGQLGARLAQGVADPGRALSARAVRPYRPEREAFEFIESKKAELGIGWEDLVTG
jgi:hypothetical protein